MSHLVISLVGVLLGPPGVDCIRGPRPQQSAICSTLTAFAPASHPDAGTCASAAQV